MIDVSRISKPKLLTICRYSFGYQIDGYHWCKYLRDEFDVHYVCLEDRFDRPVILLDGVSVTYVSAKKNTYLRGLRYILHLIQEVRSDYDLCLVQYFPGCACLRLANPKAVIGLDFRSGAISAFLPKRWFFNILLRLESTLFLHKSILSKTLEQRLRLKNSYLIPLGAEIISSTTKSFKKMHLVYVGTLQNRKIDKTVIGFSQFYKEYKDKVDLCYTIIGDGPGNEEFFLRELARKRGLSKVVNLTGYVQYTKLKKYFDVCNIGVSFIPMTTYYDTQPSTKTYEYLLSGMAVIATETSENRRIINGTNGVLISDNATAFANGLEELFKRRYEFISDEIRKPMMQYTWENIVNFYLKPYLANLRRKSDHQNGIS